MYWINKPYVRLTASNLFTPVYVANETYSLYFNSDALVSDPAFYGGGGGAVRLWLINSAGNQVFNFGHPSIVQVGAGAQFPLHVYKTFVFPAVAPGQYYFQLYDLASHREMARTNLILVQFDPFAVTSKLRFRHSDRLYGVRYDLLPDFYQEFRLPINQVKPVEFQSQRTEYRESSNGRNLRRSKSFRDMKLTMEFYFGTDEDHQALSAVLEHDEVYIDGFRIINTKQIEVAEESPFTTLSKSTFEILLDEYVEDFGPTSPTYGDGILYGGSSLHLPGSIIHSGT